MLIETFITLPISLPPSVLGFYLLVLFSPNLPFGNFIKEVFNLKMVFTFKGILFASCIYSLPFMFTPIKDGLDAIDRNLIYASYTLGKSELETFFRIIISNIKNLLISAFITTFAHTFGAFGVLLIIGGNIPNKTRVASIAIYEKVMALDFSTANVYALILLSINFIVLIIVNIINNKSKEKVYD